jgi:tetratricopeptide repeat protein 30
MPSDAPEKFVAEGCILYKEEKYEEARGKFQESINMTGY